jgi:hypothetical protein
MMDGGMVEDLGTMCWMAFFDRHLQDTVELVLTTRAEYTVIIELRRKPQRDALSSPRRIDFVMTAICS